MSTSYVFLNPKRRHMLKFDILDDSNFGTPYLLHSKFVFDENYWIGFQFKSRFCVTNFS